MRYHAVLVTGAPAAGKSTLLRELEARISPVRIVEFGQLIRERLKARGEDLTHAELRIRSAQAVSASDVAELDEQIVVDIAQWLDEQHLLIGSHAVTHEDFGVRVTAFSQRTLGLLPLAAVVVVQAPPAVLVERAAARGQGRTWTTHEQARRLQDLQTALALTYGVACGCPVYVFDAEESPSQLADVVLATLQRDRIFA